MFVGSNSTPFEIVSGTHRLTTELVDGVPCKVITCITAGIIRVDARHFFATPTEAAFGGFRFWTYKTDAGILDVNFISSSRTALGGYTLTHAADESLAIVEVGVGNVVAGGTATHSAWHRHDCNRRFTGLFTPYLNGTAWGAPAIDLTTTTSLGILVDLDAGCKLGYGDETGGHCVRKTLGEQNA